MKVFTFGAITIGLLALGAGALTAQSGNDLFQQALVKERTDGDVSAAITLYQTIVEKHPNDRALVAKALVQMGGCYEKLGSGDAIKTYQRVEREFGDQRESVATARRRLAALQSPASPTARAIWGDVDELEYGPIGLSADGRYMSYTDSTTLDLAVRDLRNGTTRHLTNTKEIWATGSEDYAALSIVSPDGRHVAYAWEVTRGEFRGTYDLRILPLNGQRGEPIIVHQSQETRKIWPAAWTPDGKSLLVIRRVQDATWQLAIVSIAERSIRVLKSLDWREPNRVSPSPDGRTIAYDAPVDRHAPARDVFLLATDGSRETVVVQNAANDEQPVWSPDGSQILFVSNRTGKDALWTVRLEAGKPRGSPELLRADIGRLLGVTRSGALYHLLPGGPRRTDQRINNIYTVDVDANMKVTGTPVMATGRFIDSNVDPRVSPDGQYLAYRRLRPSASEEPSVIVIRSLATGEERDLRPGLSVGGPLSWFRDGRSLLVRAVELQGEAVGFHSLDVTSGELELLLRPNLKPRDVGWFALSPDGKSILYLDNSAARLVRFDLESRSGAELPVEGGLAGIGGIAVSPDSGQLALQRANTLAVAPVAGGARRKVFQYAGSAPADISLSGWTPDQLYLLFVVDYGPVFPARNVQELWRVPAAGGEPERLGLSVNKARLVSPQLGPGSNKITYQLGEARRFELWALENFLPKPRASK